MYNSTLAVEKFSHLFPYMENILQFGVYSYNIQTKEVCWSEGMYHIIGIKPYSETGSQKKFHTYICKEDILHVTSEVKKAIKNKQPYHLEFSITDELGVFKRISAENFIKSNDIGIVTEYYGIIKDITENYTFKKELEQKINQLDKSNQNLQEFVYIASHDLQEPLRKISIFTERLNKKHSKGWDKDANMFLNRIMASTSSMKKLLEDLIEFSKLAFDDRKYEKINLQQSIDHVISDMELKIEESKTRIIYDHLMDIEAYPFQIKQLFINLINNSIKFKKENTDPIIKIACRHVDYTEHTNLALKKDIQYIEITIEDNGIGFDQEFAERIFKIFQRLHGKAEYNGSGLGLTICKKIIDNHKGFIFANGLLGVGSVFTILLPQEQS